MEEEAEKLKEMQGEVEKQMMSTKTGERYACVIHTPQIVQLHIDDIHCHISFTQFAGTFPTPEEKQEADSRSVHVGNVCLKQCSTFAVHIHVLVHVTYALPFHYLNRLTTLQLRRS